MELDPQLAAAGVRHLALDTVGSTNLEALAQARAGDRGPLWITAKRQTAGRGRRNRAFISEPGNLYASLLLADPCPPERAPQLSFVAALALHDAVVECAPELVHRLRFKWPNDLLCDGRKLAGILVEGETSFRLPFAAVAGIGVNCVHHPSGLSYPATDLAEAGAAVGPDRLFGALARAVFARVAEWDRGSRFPIIRAAWLERAAGLGRPVRAQLPDGEMEGCFETLDSEGRLMLRLADGSSRVIAVADMFLLDFEFPEPGKSSPSALRGRHCSE
jgi:BirA family transcriptional regulator, biotin operon repressor / biotin---[acetyl-CoA-carboxylase] ligase